MKNQYTNLAYLHAKPGQTKALGAALQTLVQLTRADPTCLVYDLHRSVDDPDPWFLYEIWRSKEDLNAHFEMPFMKDFVGESKKLVEGEFDMRGFKPIPLISICIRQDAQRSRPEKL